MNIPHLVNDTSLSGAWCQILEHILNNSGTEITPLVLTLTEFKESIDCKTILNADLMAHGLASVETVSETIFPQSLYEYSRKDSGVLYKKYLNDNLPRIIKIESGNRKGTYFERLIAFGANEKVNQLDIIISSLKEDSKVKRRSKLQAAIFDPLQDHSEGAFQGFPCLQHVTFYKSETGGLILNSFYAMQYLYQRAYGNWLGLINLGNFVANETNTKLERFTCFVGVEKLDYTKAEGKKLLNKIRLKESTAYQNGKVKEQKSIVK